MDSERPRLGFIGLGLMGTPIALKLRERGHPLTVWGRTPAKLEPALAAGARAAESAAAVAAASDVVFLCVTDTAAVEAVVFGEAGVAAGADSSKVLVDHSSIRPEATRAMAARLLSETGMRWLDAPVSGGVPGVASKTLAVMAGGEPEVFERVRPIVMDYAGRVTLMGPVGAGQTTKLINQALVGAGFALLAEVTQLALQAGIAVDRVPEALAGGRADSRLLQEYLPLMAARDLTPPRGRIDIMLKDLETVAALARATRTAMPITALAAELHRLAAGRGFAAADNGALIRLYDADAPESPTA